MPEETKESKVNLKAAHSRDYTFVILFLAPTQQQSLFPLSRISSSLDRERPLLSAAPHLPESGENLRKLIAVEIGFWTIKNIAEHNLWTRKWLECCSLPFGNKRCVSHLEALSGTVQRRRKYNKNFFARYNSFNELRFQQQTTLTLNVGLPRERDGKICSWNVTKNRFLTKMS